MQDHSPVCVLHLRFEIFEISDSINSLDPGALDHSRQDPTNVVHLYAG